MAIETNGNTGSGQDVRSVLKLSRIACIMGASCALAVLGGLFSYRLTTSQTVNLLVMQLGDAASWVALATLILSVAGIIQGKQARSTGDMIFGTLGIVFSIIALLPSAVAFLIGLAMGTGGGIPR